MLSPDKDIKIHNHKGYTVLVLCNSKILIIVFDAHFVIDGYYNTMMNLLPV